MNQYKRNNVTVILAIVSILLITTVFSVMYFQTKNALPQPAIDTLLIQSKAHFIPTEPQAIKKIALKDLAGNTSYLQERDDWQLVNFGYMFCPDICPLNLQMLANVKNNWDQAYQQQLLISHITFDPARDKPDNLRPFLAYHHKEIYGLTGQLNHIQQIAEELYMVFIHEKPDEWGNYLITHTDTIALLNPKGKLVGLFKGPHVAENIFSSLEEIIQPKP